jgi:hypothetical protein
MTRGNGGAHTVGRPFAVPLADAASMNITVAVLVRAQYRVRGGRAQTPRAPESPLQTPDHRPKRAGRRVRGPQRDGLWMGSTTVPTRRTTRRAKP